MEGELLLGVKMCGNCNPAIESMQVARRVARALDARIVPYGQGRVNLTISACFSACVEEQYPSPAVIRGLSLNGRPCSGEDDLVEQTAACLKNCLNKSCE